MGLPRPEPGLVLNYTYLWHRELRAGKEEGQKDRPCVVMLAAKRAADEALLVTVLPVTHAAPADPQEAIEIPQRVKIHLGLDDARSWIVIAECNEFIWPGYDLRKIRRSGEYAYGFLPPLLFGKANEAFARWLEAGRARIAPRS